MKPQETYYVLARLKILFPQWAEWVAGLATKQETLRAWCGALLAVELGDCEEIMTQWQSGRKQAPASYDRERVVYLLVEAARHLRSQRTSKAQSEQVRAECGDTQEIRKKRGEYKTVQDRAMRQAVVKFNLLADEIPRPKSQWTEEDLRWYRERADEVVREFMKAEEAKSTALKEQG